MLVSSERRVLLAGCGGWFVLREKYCWLVADKPSEQAVGTRTTSHRAISGSNFLSGYFWILVGLTRQTTRYRTLLSIL
jgi:hypothetical protein